MPSGGLLNRLAAAVVVRNQAARNEVAIRARREARLVLTDQVLRRGRRGAELLRIQVAAAGDAVNVGLLLTAARVRARVLVFAFAFGEAGLSLHRGGT